MEFSLQDFLVWLATSGGASVVASFILERVPSFQKLVGDAKRWVFFIVCVVLSLGSYAILTYVPVEILTALAPYFAMIASVFVSVFSGELWHRFDRQLPKG